MRHRWTFGLAIAVLGLSLPSWLRAQTFMDQTDPAMTGGIVLPVSSTDGLHSATVFEPTELLTYAATIDTKDNTVSVKGIPPGEYCLILRYDTVVIDGIPLEPLGGVKELSPTDRKAIEEVTWVSDDYFNIKQIVRMAGNDQRVMLYVEQVRDRMTYEPDGTPMTNIITRRLEVRTMRKSGQVWVITSHKWLHREEVAKTAKNMKLTFVHQPQLGHVLVGDEVVRMDPLDLAGVRDQTPRHSYQAQRRIK